MSRAIVVTLGVVLTSLAKRSTMGPGMWFNMLTAAAASMRPTRNASTKAVADSHACAA